MSQQRVAVIRGLFGFLAVGVAAVAGYYAYDRTASWWLVAFVVMMALFAFSRAIPDLITDTDKLRRAIFFGTPVAFAIGGLAAAYALWSEWWSAVLVGFGVGGVGWMLVTVKLPDIAEEEQEDSTERMTAGARAPAQTPNTSQHAPGVDPQLAEIFRATREAGITFTLEEEREVARLHAAGQDDEIARLVERKAGLRDPVGAGS